MSDDPEFTVTAEIEAMKAHLGVNLDRELASRLGVDPSAIAAWRRRKSVPEKYRTAYKRAQDERVMSGIPFAPIAPSRLRDGYVFSLLEQIAKTPLPEHFELLPEEWFLIWRGVRLSSAYSYIQDMIPQTTNKDELRAAYDEVRKEIGNADFLEWLESLR